MTDPIYLDGFATLPLAPEAQEAMLAAWRMPGNAGSPNFAGEWAAGIIAEGRQSVADLIGASSSEITFTSGATEANNLALLGLARAARRNGTKRNLIIVSAVEHKAILEPALALRDEGFEVSIAPVDARGQLDLVEYAKLVTEDLLIASVMLVNNETGVIQPVKDAAALAHHRKSFKFTETAAISGDLR